jgi:crotonobetainyl-CoA:carnitine CoA-transferase CaiB-like acyl-CoA transferase
VKIESTQRPDGGRRGSPAFFERLSAGKAGESIDFSTRDGLARLRAHLESADIVIEASRPRALRQLGIDAEALVQARDGLTWISITGYGREEPEAHWIAYGDDAAVAGGLSHALYAAAGQRLFVGDAIADPLTGLHAALAAMAALTSGGSRLLSIPMRDVVAHVVQHA